MEVAVYICVHIYKRTHAHHIHGRYLILGLIDYKKGTFTFIQQCEMIFLYLSKHYLILFCTFISSLENMVPDSLPQILQDGIYLQITTDDVVFQREMPYCISTMGIYSTASISIVFNQRAKGSLRVQSTQAFRAEMK